MAKAKKAISGYKKASGQPEGLAELMVFFCERAAGFINDVGLQDEGYLDTLVRMFDQAIKTIKPLPADRRQELLERLESVRHTSDDFGYGVTEEMADLLANVGFYDGPQ